MSLANFSHRCAITMFRSSPRKGHIEKSESCLRLKHGQQIHNHRCSLITPHHKCVPTVLVSTGTDRPILGIQTQDDFSSFPSFPGREHTFPLREKEISWMNRVVCVSSLRPENAAPPVRWPIGAEDDVNYGTNTAKQVCFQDVGRVLRKHAKCEWEVLKRTRARTSTGKGYTSKKWNSIRVSHHFSSSPFGGKGYRPGDGMQCFAFSIAERFLVWL